MSSNSEKRSGLKNLGSRLTLRSQLLFTHTVLVAGSVFAFGATLFAMTIHATYRQAESDLLAVANTWNQSLAEQRNPESLSISDLYRQRFGPAPRDHAYVALWDIKGELVFSTGELPHHATPIPKPPSATGPRPFHARETGRHLDLIVATTDGGQLLVGRPLSKEWDRLWWILVRIIILGGGACIFAACLAYWLSNRLASPLSQLATAAQLADFRKPSQPFLAGPSSTEIISLASSMNEMLSRMKMAYERQSRFTADASHELRTPVTVILSQCEHTLHRERSSEVYREALQTCLQSSLRMKRLIDDLLLLSKADSENFASNMKPVDLSEIVAWSVKLLKPLASSMEVSLNVESTSVRMLGNPEQLGQVVTNLVNNSIRYNKSGGAVTISVYQKDSNAMLRVVDDGIGIDPSEHALIFDRFYRADQARTQRSDFGAGLGLSIVREIVDAHQGTIHVSSSLGKGTTMEIAFSQSPAD